ncbi:MAG: hypothetical protein PHI89_08160 [Thiovulaceae bacterium]|nr:hypothetical protein [Sulfurimonadaceae bacterium]
MRNIILIVTLNIVSTIFLFGDEKIGFRQVKENEKCVASTSLPKHSLELSYDQFCEYGKLGCKDIPKVKNIIGYCTEKEIAMCFSKRQWLTKNQFLGIPENMEITLTRTHTSLLNGVVTKSHCFEYQKKKPFVMTKEKFLQYKKLTPSVIDIMNQQIEQKIQCFSKKVSRQNIDDCMKKTDKTIEELIASFLPFQVEKLCKKENGTVHFVWNEENHNALINALKGVVEKNLVHRECVLKSANVDELAKCMNKAS